MGTRQLPEQIAFEYTPAPVGAGTADEERGGRPRIVRRPGEPTMRTRRGERGRSNMSGEHREGAKGERKRTVRPHQEIVQPPTWAERDKRRAHYRQSQAQHYTADRMTKRTFLQTGTAAPEGRVKLEPRPLPPMRQAIPVRSGQQKRRKSFWRRFLALFAVLTLVIVACSFALFSPSFRVRSVTVSGTDNSSLIKNIEQMGMQSQNIFLIDLTGLTNRIDAIPLVEIGLYQEGLARPVDRECGGAPARPALASQREDVQRR